MRGINKVIVHCSDSDISDHDNINTIRQWHIERGFSDIGYHLVITKDGELHYGRDLDVVGAHCKGQNWDSIGICLTGRDEFTNAQKKTLRAVCGLLRRFYGLEKGDIVPHRLYDVVKTCPNFSLEAVLI